MHKGVQGVIIMNNDGKFALSCSATLFNSLIKSIYLPVFFMLLALPIRTTMDNPMTAHYCALAQQLVMKSRAGVRDGDPTNDLTFLRIRSKKNEIMIAPGSLFF